MKPLSYFTNSSFSQSTSERGARGRKYRPSIHGHRGTPARAICNKISAKSKAPCWEKILKQSEQGTSFPFSFFANVSFDQQTFPEHLLYAKHQRKHSGCCYRPASRGAIIRMCVNLRRHSECLRNREHSNCINQLPITYKLVFTPS